MSRWFRVYDDLLNDPKCQRLTPDLFKTWVNCLCAASKNNGVLPPIEELSFLLRLSDEQTGAHVDALVASGLVDETDDGLEPHNWANRQYQSDTSNERVKRYRDKKRNVTPTVTVTPPDTDTDTDTEQKEPRASALHRRKERLSDSREFENEFWPAYPNKVGKPVALKAFTKARKAESLETIMDGLRRYIRTKPPDRAWCNPSTWLNQERWNDEPAAETPITRNEGGHDRILRALAKVSEERAAARGGSVDSQRAIDDGAEDGPDQSGRILELAALRASNG